jgi:ACS family pantothenate transporter-like MFS transporter
MGYWLKSFNKKPPPVPGKSYTVPQINNRSQSIPRLSCLTDMTPVPLPTTGIFIVVALAWGWLSDAYRGARAPFIYAGAILTFVFTILMRQLPLYTNIEGRIAVYWLSNVGFGAGPLILSWINEICSADTEKRALLVAMGNDLAYVVQAVAPNFVWKTTDADLACHCDRYDSAPALER